MSKLSLRRNEYNNELAKMHRLRSITSHLRDSIQELSRGRHLYKATDPHWDEFEAQINTLQSVYQYVMRECWIQTDVVREFERNENLAE